MIDPQELGAWLDGEATAEERQHFEEQLPADPKDLEELTNQISLDQALRCLLGNRDSEQRIIASVRAMLSAPPVEEFKAELMKRIELAQSDYPRDAEASPAISASDRMGRRLAGLPFQAWLAAAACLAVFIGLYFTIAQFKSPAPVAIVIGKQAVVIVERGASVIHVKEGEKLRAGDTIRVGKESSATIRYADSTQIEIGADSVLTVRQDGRGTNAGKKLELQQGSLMAIVAKQPSGRPMVFVTPTAEATVLGTRLLLAANEQFTRLEVREGRVTLTRASDQASVEVSAGQSAVAADGVALKSTPLVAEGGDKTYKPDDEGFVRNWLALDAIKLNEQASNPSKDSQQEFFDKDYLPNQKTATPKAGDKVKVEGNELVWKAKEAGDFALRQDGENSLFLGVAYLICEQDIPNVTLAIGSDDSSLWRLNGKEVIRVYAERGVERDQDKSEQPLTLKAGLNVLSFAVVNGVVVAGAAARFLDQSGHPITSFQVSLTPPAAAKASVSYIRPISNLTR